MSKPLIITISGKARHGKDTTGDIIQAILEIKGKRVLRMAYGDYVKFTAEKYLGWDGIKNEEGRTILQQWGTEKVRSVDPNFWIDTVIRLVDIMNDEYDCVVITDCRFENEVYRWHECRYDVLSLLVKRIGFENSLNEEQKNHASETAMDDFPFSTCVIAKEIEDLHDKIKATVIPLIEDRLKDR